MTPRSPDSVTLPRRLGCLLLGLCLAGGPVALSAADRPLQERQAQERSPAPQSMPDRSPVPQPMPDRSPAPSHPDSGRGNSGREGTTPRERTPDTPRPDHRGPENRGPDHRGPGPQGGPGHIRHPSPEDRRPHAIPHTALAKPRAWDRCLVRPTYVYWAHRDIMAEIQAMARRGYILVHPIADTVAEFDGVAEFPAGWIAYGIRVPPGGKLHIRLTHPNEGWFRLTMMNKWGGLEPGMLQNLIPTGNPEVTYTNLSQEGRSVYVLVDDPGWMSSAADPFRIKVERSWDPLAQSSDEIPVATGIWARPSE